MIYTDQYSRKTSEPNGCNVLREYAALHRVERKDFNVTRFLPAIRVFNISIDMTIYVTYYVTMKTTSVAELKKNLCSFLVLAEQGEEIEVLKRNIPVAHLIGIPRNSVNRTRLGCGQGTGRILGDLTESILPLDRWNMLRGEL